MLDLGHLRTHAPLDEPVGLAGSAGLQVGVEHEFTIRVGDRRLDFRRVIGELGLPGVGLDPGDPYARRLPSGVMVTCDGAEAEVATPPVVLTPGWTAELIRWCGAAAGSLTAALPSQLRAYGVSTHISVSIPDEAGRAVAAVFARTFAPALMLLMDRAQSPGLLIRPRHGRLEFGGEYATGDTLAAAAALATGGTICCLRAVASGAPEELPAPLHVSVEPARERFGLYVDRRAFGPDLYDDAANARLSLSSGGTIPAAERLAEAWTIAAAALGDRLGPEDRAGGEAIVAGRLPLPSEQPGTTSPMQGAPPGESVYGRAASPAVRPGYRLEPVAVRWDLVVYRIVGRRTAVLALPSSALASFFAALDGGEIDQAVEAHLAAPVTGNTLRDWTQTRTVGLFDDVAITPLLATPERDRHGTLRLAPVPVTTASGRAPTARDAAAGSRELSEPTTGHGPAAGGRPMKPLGLPPVIVADESQAPDAGSGETIGPAAPTGPGEQAGDEEDAGTTGRSRWWGWLALALVAAALAAIGVFSLGSAPEPAAIATSSSTPAPAVSSSSEPPPSEPTTSGAAPTSSSQPPPSSSEPPPSSGPPPPPPIEFPEEFLDLVDILRAMGLGDEAILAVIEEAVEDPVGDGIFALSDFPAAVFDDDVDITRMIAVAAVFRQAVLDAAFNSSTFECGEETAVWIVVCADDPPPIDEGDVFVVAAIHAGVLPGPDDPAVYVYTALFDSDRDDGDNFTNVGALDWHFYQNTDRWYQLNKTRRSGWSVVASEWRGRRSRDVATGARAVISGSTIVWFIPGSEIPSPQPLVRISALEHDGSFSPQASGGDVPGPDPTTIFEISRLDLEAAVPGSTTTTTIPSVTPSTSSTTSTTTTTTGPPGSAETVQEFIAALAAALESGDLDFVYDRIHPVVFQVADEQTCRDFVENRFSLVQDYRLTGAITGPTTQSVATPEGDVSVPNVYRAEVTFGFSGTEFTSQAQYALVDGTMYWFTTCE